MVKRIISVLMALVMCMTFTPTVFSVGELPSATDGKANETFEHETYKIPVSDEYMEKLFGAPEEVLAGSTQELLDHFLDSLFLTFCISSSDSVGAETADLDFNDHAAFRELLTRDDFLEVLSLYVRNVYYKVTTDEYEIEKLYELVTHIPENYLISKDSASVKSKGADAISSENASKNETYKIPVSEEYMQKVFGAPEDVLKGPTDELLDYFMSSVYFSGCVFPPISSFSNIKPESAYNYTEHAAFRELITREDLGIILSEYVDNVYDNLTTDEEDMITVTDTADRGEALSSFLWTEDLKTRTIHWDIYKLNKIIYHIPDDVIISAFAISSLDNGSSSSVIEDVATIADYDDDSFVGELYGVSYYYTDPIITVNGNEVPAYESIGTLYPFAYSAYVSQATELGVDIVAYPNGSYNCHSYAWKDRSSANDIWIDHIDGFRYDDACIQLNDDSIQEGDIMVYFGAYGNVLHSAVLYEVPDNIEYLVLISKWGQGALCIHSETDVPPGYLLKDFFDMNRDGVVEDDEFIYYANIRFYRYPVGDSASTSSSPYEEFGESVEIVAALPVSVSYIINGDDESAD